MISHDHDRGQKVEVNSVSHSTLYLPNVRKSDSGNYTCEPHNLRPAFVYIHIIDEDSNSAAAAIHTDDGAESVASSSSNASSNQLQLAFSFLMTLKQIFSA